MNPMTGTTFRPVAALTHAVFLRAAVLLLTFGPCIALAEGPTIVHPFLTDRVTIEAGLYFPNKDFKARVDGTFSSPDREIDFESELGNKTSDDVFDVELLWRVSHKWSVTAIPSCSRISRGEIRQSSRAARCRQAPASI